MAGILNKKNRFIDLILTEEGKRQLFDGDFRATFASVSDKYSLYTETDHVEEEKIDRFNFEAYSLPIDNIVLETDDSGRLTLPNDSSEYSVVGNKIFEKDAESTKLKYKVVSTGSFASTANSIKASSINHFKKNNFIGTKQIIEKFDNFELEDNKHTFVISNSVPFARGPLTEHIDIDNAEPFMFDSKLAHYKNFNFLPPVNKSGSLLSDYPNMSNNERSSWDSIKESLNITTLDFDPLEQEGSTVNYEGDIPIINRAPNLNFDNVLAKEFKKVIFEKTSQFNNILLQVYEKNKNSKEIIKLDVVDAGEFFDESSPDNPHKHVFYVGKVYFDSQNIPTFVNMFTLVYD